MRIPALVLMLVGLAAPVGSPASPRTVAREAATVLAPPFRAHPGEPGEVAALEAAIDRLQALQRDGGWIRVPSGETLRRGDRGRAVALLAARLIQEGDLDPADAPLDRDLVHGEAPAGTGAGASGARADGATFSASTERAVARYQERHGLRADGIAGPVTFGAMSVPVEDRIRTLEANLQRARDADPPADGMRLVINVPDFELRLIDADGSIVRTHRVVIGKEARSTPTLHSYVDTVVLNPVWYLPRSIASTEILAKAQEDPTSIARGHFRVYGPDGEELDPENLPWDQWTPETFPYRIEQAPGPWNSLGRVKFLFDNSHAVYLHDTPAAHLFDRHERDFSHGCIRVEHPMELAAALLGGSRTAERLEKAVEEAGDRPKVLQLPDPVPIAIVYRTAWVGTDGALRFGPDVYGLDRKAAASSGSGEPAAR